MTRVSMLRLNGLEPDNLLAFLALLGLLRALERAQPRWLPRVAWTVDAPPVRPALHVNEQATGEMVLDAAVAGLDALVPLHGFDGLKDLKLAPETAAERLRAAAAGDRYAADLWAALVSDAVVRVKNNARETEPTPLCLLGTGKTNFLSNLASVPKESSPPAPRGTKTLSAAECLGNALFQPWTRPDDTKSFRWDPHEAVRHALRATDPTDAKTKERTQHGANRLAAVGLSALTVVPRSSRTGMARLEVLGGTRERGHRGGRVFTWPIWRHPISLATIRALLGHPRLREPAARDALGVVELRRARRISVDRYQNVTRAESA